MNLFRAFRRWFRDPELSRIQVVSAIWKLPDPIRPSRQTPKVRSINLLVIRDEQRQRRSA